MISRGRISAESLSEYFFPPLYSSFSFHFSFTISIGLILNNNKKKETKVFTVLSGRKQIKNNSMAVTQNACSAACSLQYCGRAIQSANYMVTMVSVSVVVILCNSISQVHKDESVTGKAVYKKVVLFTLCLYTRAELSH